MEDEHMKMNKAVRRYTYFCSFIHNLCKCSCYAKSLINFLDLICPFVANPLSGLEILIEYSQSLSKTHTQTLHHNVNTTANLSTSKDYIVPVGRRCTRDISLGEK